MISVSTVVAILNNFNDFRRCSKFIFGTSSLILRLLTRGGFMVYENVQQLYFSRNLAGQHFSERNYEGANLSIYRGLNTILDVEMLIHNIESKLLPFKVKNSEVVFLGGEQNIGYIETITEKGIFLTKLLFGKSRSYAFYEHIYPNLDFTLKEERSRVSPFYAHHYFEEIDIYAITMYKVEMKKIDVEKHLDAIVSMQFLYSHHPLNTLNYFDIVDDIDRFYLINEHRPNHPIAALHSFGNIHKKSVVEDLFYQLGGYILEQDSPFTFQLLSKWKNIILQKDFYNTIEVEKHYGIQHADFFPQNLTIRNNRIQCIDWECIRIGPKTADLSGILATEKIKFSTIKQVFLDNENYRSHLSLIDYVLFLFMLWVCWVIVQGVSAMEKEYMKSEQWALLLELENIN